MLLKNDDDDSKECVTFLQQTHVKREHRHQQSNRNTVAANNIPLLASITDRTPGNSLELKQKRPLTAADRRKRTIAHMITVIGILIVFLCAAIVALTLKMAPKIDELVRTKTGKRQFTHMFRMTTTTTAEFNNFTTNNTSTVKFPFHTERRSFA